MSVHVHFQLSVHVCLCLVSSLFLCPFEDLAVLKTITFIQAKQKTQQVWWYNILEIIACVIICYSSFVVRV